jgi:8-oxo-dGTP diphosphatase
MAVPQFGRPQPGRDYPDRPAAFVVVERDGLIATVHVDAPHRGLDLPGGGLDPGETAAQAAVRECGEEAGLRIAVEGEPFARADHFHVNQHGETHNTRGRFFAGRLVGEDPSLKIEADHTLLWLPPQEALVRLHRESHAWAVAAWLRLRARA